MPSTAPWPHGGDPASPVLDAPVAHESRCVCAGRRGVSVQRAV
ncbi:MAG: hypothetical protein AAF799_39585 [Myxococcota bacterium]